MRPLLLPVLLVLAACNGRVTVDVTDAPVDNATAVVVEFTGVELVRDDGGADEFEFGTPKSIDLLALEGGETARLIDESVSDGDYKAIRLLISADGSGDDSWVEVDGEQVPLEIAEDDEDRLEIARSFTASPSEDTSFTIDFDLRRSVLEPQDTNYRLVPRLRMVRNEDAGKVSGIVAASNIDTGCVPAVYFYSGNNVTPGDVGSSTEPLNSARVKLSGTTWSYRAGLLPEGEYTAALTCEADLDAPESDDGIEFDDTRNVTVEAGETATADF